MLALLGAHLILHVSRIRVNILQWPAHSYCHLFWIVWKNSIFTHMQCKHKKEHDLYMTNANLTVKKSSVGQGCTNMGQLCVVVSNMKFAACQPSDT